MPCPLRPHARGDIPWKGGTRTRRPAHAPPRGPQQPGPDRAEAPVDQDQAAHRTFLHGAEDAGPERRPAHGVRGSRLPEHLRVLGGPRGDVPHRRRPVHPAVGLLPDLYQARAARRCASPRRAPGKPQPLDEGEPRRVAESVAAMGLRYATVTGVARDDLADGGAWLYAQVCREIHAAIPGCGVELLIPDFNAEPDRLAEVFSARPEVLGHNIETVPRIFRRIRPGFRYSRSLDVLRAAREAGLVTKSNLILGLGEERHEITEAMRDLRAADCDLLTITQYLRPTPRHHPVERWVKPEE